LFNCLALTELTSLTLTCFGLLLDTVILTAAITHALWGSQTHRR